MPSRLLGGPALKARLAAIPAGAPELVSAWAQDTADRARNTAPNARRSESRKWSTKVQGTRGGVYGAFWWIFVDRGTKAHDIVAKNSPQKFLKFQKGGRTIFAKSVHKGRIRRRPFISTAAQQALASSALLNVIERIWARRRTSGRTRFI